MLTKKAIYKWLLVGLLLHLHPILPRKWIDKLIGIFIKPFYVVVNGIFQMTPELQTLCGNGAKYMIRADLPVCVRYYIKDGHFEFVLGDKVIAKMTQDQMYKFRQWSLTVSTPGAIYYLPYANPNDEQTSQDA